MKHLILVLFFLTSVIWLSCVQKGVEPEENPTILWERIFGGNGIDDGLSVQQTNDGGYIIAGKTSAPTYGSDDVYLLKVDIWGSQVFASHFGGVEYDAGYSVQQTTDMGFIIAGSNQSEGPGVQNVYLVKTDSLGNLQWSNTFGGSGDQVGRCVQQTNDGGYIIAGWTDSFGAGEYDVCLIKTNASGDQLWFKTFGGVEGDKGYYVRQTSDGGFIIGGFRDTYPDTSGHDVYLIKTDANGNELWSKTYGGTAYDEGYCVQQTNDMGFIITGITHSFGLSNNNVYLVKTDSLGNQQWYKTFGGTTNSKGNSVQQTSDGGFIIVGECSSDLVDIFFIKTDAEGDLEWYKTFGGTITEDIGHCVQQTSDGGYIIAGSTAMFFQFLSPTDVYLIRTDEQGNAIP